MSSKIIDMQSYSWEDCHYNFFRFRCQSKDQMDVIIGKKTAVNPTIDIKGET